MRLLVSLDGLNRGENLLVGCNEGQLMLEVSVDCAFDRSGAHLNGASSE
jgi:hypothetical protein